MSTEPLFLSDPYRKSVQSTVTGIIALGLVFVLLTGEIDLSVAATSGVASVFMAKLVMVFGLPVPLAILAGVVLGGLVGAASARWVTLIGVPSFVVTLGVGLVLNGIQLLLLPRTFGEADMALRLQVTVFFFFCLLSSPSSFLFIFFFFYFHLLHLLLLLLLLLFSFILK